MLHFRPYQTPDIPTITDFYRKEKTEFDLPITPELEHRLGNFEELYDQHKNGMLVGEVIEGTKTFIAAIAGWKDVNEETREIGPLYLDPILRGREMDIEGYGRGKVSGVLYTLLENTLCKIEGVTSIRSVISEERKASIALAEKAGMEKVETKKVVLGEKEVEVFTFQKNIR